MHKSSGYITTLLRLVKYHANNFKVKQQNIFGFPYNDDDDKLL